MTVEELILIDKNKVRRDSNLMSLYLQYFKETFKYAPNCAGCSFASDWQKLVSFYSKKVEKKVTLQKENAMSTISIKRIQGKILSYKKDGRTFRQYDNILTDAFVKEYLSNGTEEEIEERKKLFNFTDECNTKELSASPKTECTDGKFQNVLIVERPNTTSTLESLGNNSEPVKEIKRRKKRTPKNG